MKPTRRIPIPNAPVAQRSIGDVIDSIEQKRAEAEWNDTVKLAETIFPREWNVRVEPYSDGVHVQVRYFIARGRTPTEALRNAIEWYRSKGGSRIILPGQEGR